MTNDTVLNNFIDTFSKEYCFESLDDSKKFELFVNYNIVSKFYPRSFDIEELSVDGENDTGIDGIAIIVNGNIINSPEEIYGLIENDNSIETTFVLIQSKKSSRTKSDWIGTFIFGVKSLFDDSPSIEENEKIKIAREIKNAIYSKSINFASNPTLKLYFANASKWKESEYIKNRAKRELEELNNKNLFSEDVVIDFYDAEKLKTTYREINRKVIKEISIPTQVALPEISNQGGVKQSFLGCASAIDYIKLISDSDGNLSRGLFYDNVRDYQGNNKVNLEIKNTLNSRNEQSLLLLLNNGITIISRKIDRVGNKIKLTDFQIINGCQTSYVLFNNRDKIAPETNIVLKIIETNDQEIINKIIRATNRQTEVKEESFESIKPFHRGLQEYYKAIANKIKYPIYYERRSKEFIDNANIKPYQIISLSGQIKSYVSTVLAQPQSTHRYFGELLNSNRDKIFVDKTGFEDYYLSALIVNRIETLYKRKNTKYKRFKYHLALIIFKKIKQEIKNNLCYEDLILKKESLEELAPYIKDAEDALDTALKNTAVHPKEVIRSREFTQELLKTINPAH
ncbi:AIPR family protein [Campylobacter sp. CCUG 57310]|uniref:AIPR family protein n=1 Tax=Campylobacter sp. CCUG 57310 TaxID=2517362 RepID=UPI001562EAEC|nr:AIPR family protein [Campylobacter sp. CCUG 57310]QKF91406.1 AIPR domain-containing protein [Campylobacter sp. CCUG 57310]